MEKHVDIARQGVAAWNRWREQNPHIIPILKRADLSGENLAGANLRRARLQRADLSQANLAGADLSGAILSGADLSNADLDGAKIHQADLNNAILLGVDLGVADCLNVNLRGALTEAQLRLDDAFPELPQVKTVAVLMLVEGMVGIPVLWTAARDDGSWILWSVGVCCLVHGIVGAGLVARRGWACTPFLWLSPLVFVSLVPVICLVPPLWPMWYSLFSVSDPFRRRSRARRILKRNSEA